MILMGFTVQDIVVKYLQENGYDGLVSDGGDCGCKLDDLFPCVDFPLDCRPGYLVQCDCGECDWHITTERPQSGEGK